MPFELIYTMVLLLIMTVAMIREWLELEVLMFAILLLLVLGGVITSSEAFSGFSNEGVLTIAFLFVVAGAVNNTGMIRHMHPLIFGNGHSGMRRQMLRILLPISFISAFINNTPVVAMMIPAVRSWAQKNDYAASKFLIPISFAAILGGMCTLIGTSTNLIVHGMMIEYHGEGLGLFDVSLVGVPLAVLGIVLISLWGPRLLPERREPMVELGEKTREFVIELRVTGKYENIGRTIEDAGLRHLKGLFLFQIERHGEIIAPARPSEHLLLNDRLFFTGVPQTIVELQKTPGLLLTRDSHFHLKEYDSSQIKTFECVVSHGSPLVGKTVRDSNFRGKYQAVILAIHRHGERMDRKIGDIVLAPGDTLLLLADKDFRTKWYHSKDFYLIAGAAEVPSREPWRGYLALGIFVAMIVLTISGLMSLIAAAGLGIILLLLTRTIHPWEARDLINWKVVVMIALSLGIATAVQNSGLAQFLSDLVVAAGSRFGVFGCLAAVFIATNVYSTFITSNAAAALLFPVAFSVSQAMGADVRAFALAVIMAAAASFATPISYQTNLMVYGAGRYRFTDFIRIGLPLQIIIASAALLLIYLLYL